MGARCVQGYRVRVRCKGEGYASFCELTSDGSWRSTPRIKSKFVIRELARLGHLVMPAFSERWNPEGPGQISPAHHAFAVYLDFIVTRVREHDSAMSKSGPKSQRSTIYLRGAVQLELPPVGLKRW